MPGPILYLDVDDVLAETTRAMADLARDRFGKDVAFDDMSVFDLGVSLGLDDVELAHFMEVAHEESFLLGLPPLEGAARATAQWQAANAEIHVVTGRPPGTDGITARWLGEAGIAFERLELVDKYGRYANPTAVAREALFERRYAVVVEDSPDMARLFVERTDALVLLMDRPWNRNGAETPGESDRLVRVEDWEAISLVVADRIPELRFAGF